MPPERCVEPFSGLSADFSELNQSSETYTSNFNSWNLLLGIIDSPFSLIADLLFLPYDLLKVCTPYCKDYNNGNMLKYQSGEKIGSDYECDCSKFSCKRTLTISENN